MKYLLFIFYFFLLLFLLVFSYSFIDINLSLTTEPFISPILGYLSNLYRNNRVLFSGTYIIFVILLFFGYFLLMKYVGKYSIRAIILLISACSIMGVLSYPAFSYDIFNYILTAKVAYEYKENPYVVMPVEFPNEPMLRYTRAANKVAIYGPVWIGASVFPLLLSLANIWSKIVAFKFFMWFWYVIMSVLIWKRTKKIEQVIFFAANPLVIIETLISGHNDLYMMVLAVYGCIMLQSKSLWYQGIGFLLGMSSIFVKGATIALIPIFFFVWKKNIHWERLAFWFMFAVFCITPLREEMYPWYSVWFIPFAALLPNRSIERGLTVVLTFGLLLRHAPYIATFHYDGLNSILRSVFTVIPVVLYVLYIGLMRIIEKRSIHSTSL